MYAIGIGEWLSCSQGGRRRGVNGGVIESESTALQTSCPRRETEAPGDAITGSAEAMSNRCIDRVATNSGSSEHVHETCE